MKVNLAHVRVQGIDVAVFDARPTVDSDSNRSELLLGLTMRARGAGLHVVKSALVFERYGRVTFFGTPDLVGYLQHGGPFHWTHTIDV